MTEGLRMADHPCVAFRDGPAGRRAALVSGRDIWELAAFLTEIDVHGDAAVVVAPDTCAAAADAMRAGIGYSAPFPAVSDAWIAATDEASERAE